MKRIFLFTTPFVLIAIYLLFNVALSAFFADSVLIALISDIIMMIFCLLVYHRFCQISVKSFLIKPMYLILAFVVSWLAMQFCVSSIYYLYDMIGTDTYSSAFTATSVWLNLVLSLIIAPVFEEILMRGVCLICFCKSISMAFGIFASSLLFGLLHGTMLHVISSFCFGIFLCIVYLSTGKLRYCIFFHMAGNFFSVLFQSVTFPAVCFSPFLIIPYILLCSTVLAFCIWHVRVGIDKKIVSFSV